MQAQSKSWMPVAVAIVIAAAMICATLVIVNMRVTYPLQGMQNATYSRLMGSGCDGTGYIGQPPVALGVSCPLWVRP